MTPERSPVPPSPKRRRHDPRTTAAAAASSTEIPSTASAVPLPDEIIFDILTRVPVRSACRFRCVSSEWCALISGPDFAAAHGSRAHAEPLVWVYSFRGKGTELRLVGMNGGVVRVIRDGGGTRKLSGGVLICVANDFFGTRVVEPAMGDVLVTCPGLNMLPEPLGMGRDIRRIPKVAFGMGRAVPSGEYKLVHLTDIDDVRCEVLTVKGDIGWKRAPSPPAHVTCSSTCVAVVNGILHVFGSREGDSWDVHCFDLESERWKTTIQGPRIEGGYNLSTDIRMVELKGTLCVVQSSSKTQLTDVWLLTDPNKGIWDKAYAIPMDPHTQHYTPLGMTHDGERLLFQCSFNHKPAQAVRIYDPCTNAWTDVTETSSNFACKIGLRNLRLGSFISAKT
ncbi:F-box protein At1g47340-like [Aegilops tauschii subsp. strangulata]|uniref:F-box protein At1g47340-like n=1 Tax=Aegilops tauschii subsp. strangulata TaxID=200361 RepID=UPI00098B1C23|nr:F-box protein At1g47340-like [Aegilops tauschii subsp. strangulata]